MKRDDLLVFAGLDIDDEATNFPKKLAPHESEFVILFLKIVVEDDHLGEAHGQEVQGIDAGQFGEHAMPESRLADERNILGAVGHVEAAEEILVFDGSGVVLTVILQVLQVGLDHGMHVAHLGHEEVLALYHSIEHIIESDAREAIRSSAPGWERAWRLQSQSLRQKRQSRDSEPAVPRPVLPIPRKEKTLARWRPTRMPAKEEPRQNPNGQFA